MPMVNGKEYAYTKEGMAAAKKAKEKMKNKKEKNTKMAQRGRGTFNVAGPTDNYKA